MGIEPRWDVRWYEVVDSTNLEARRLLAQGATEGLVVSAAHQTAGRGRMDRSWLDRPGKSLLVSLVFRKMDPFLATALVAVSARAAVRRLGGEGPLCKWPNDLVYGEKKVGGLLTESFRREGAEFLIIGLGLNVGYLPEELNFPARLPPTSLLLEEGKLWNVKDVLRTLLQELEERMRERSGNLIDEYRACIAYLGHRVVMENYAICSRSGGGRGEHVTSLERCGSRLEGILAGVDEKGHLLLEVDKEMVSVAAGDLSPILGT